MTKVKKPIGKCTVSPSGNPLVTCGKDAYEKFGRGIYITYACPEHIEGVKLRRRQMYTIF